MDLTEDKAKEILDFLAKKFGYDEFTLNDNQIGVIKKDGYRSDLQAWMSSNNGWHNYKFEPISSYAKFSSYAKCLKMLLAAVKNGYAITTYYDIDDFIKPFTTLEELLISYDLENGFSTT